MKSGEQERGDPARSVQTAPLRHVRRARDARGRVIALDRTPRRIVSLVPSLTELVCTLGRAPQLVGVTRYCIDPPAVVRERPRIGGTKNPDCRRIIDLCPDLVLANMEENRREDVATLEAAGLRVLVTFPATVRGTVRLITQLGRLLGTVGAAATLVTRIEDARRTLSARPRGPRPRIFCPIWRNPWMSFNRDTYAHDLLWCAGGRNVCADLPDRYPRVELADVARMQPEVILLPSEPYRFSQHHIETLQSLADTPAWQQGRVFLADGQALSWYGPRTAPALRYFHRRINQVR